MGVDLVAWGINVLILAIEEAHEAGWVWGARAGCCQGSDWSTVYLGLWPSMFSHSNESWTQTL